MVDKSDFDKLKNKFDINEIFNSVKSIINPVTGTPDVDPDDDLGLKIAQASVLLKEMSAAQATHVKNLNKVNEMLNMIFQDIESLRKEVHADRKNKGATTKPVDAVKKTAQESAVEAASDKDDVSTEQEQKQNKEK